MKIILMVFSLFSLSACGSFTSVTQTEEGTFLQLLGSRAGVTLIVDESPQLDLEKDTEAFNLNGKVATKILIPPGQHRIQIMRGGVQLVNRDIFVSEGNVFEVMIP